MSAPQIPNLLSLRGGARRGGRGRGNVSSSLHSTERRPPQSDLDVQATDSDAAVSRLSAVDLGYLDDEFAGAFVNDGRRVRRMPVINRGMYNVLLHVVEGKVVKMGW